MCIRDRPWLLVVHTVLTYYHCQMQALRTLYGLHFLVLCIMFLLITILCFWELLPHCVFPYIWYCIFYQKVTFSYMSIICITSIFPLFYASACACLPHFNSHILSPVFLHHAMLVWYMLWPYVCVYVVSVTSRCSIKWLSRLSCFMAWRLRYKEIWLTPKIRVIPLGILSQTLDSENFAMASR